MEKTELQLETINGKDLKKVAHLNSTAEVLFTYFAMRDRYSVTTDLVRLKRNLLASGEKIDDIEFLAVFKELERANMGSIIHGRGRKNDQFRWNYSLKSIGKAGVEGKDEDAIVMTKHTRKPRTTKKKKTVQKTFVKAETAISTIQNEIVIPLRNDFFVHVPSNLTKSEVQLLKSTIDHIIN